MEWRNSSLMEEEVLIIREGSVWTFNFHKSVFLRVVGKHLGKLHPLSVDSQGERVVLRLNPDEGEELRAWLFLNLNKGFFITELECLDIR